MKSSSDVIYHTAQGQPITPRNPSQSHIVKAANNNDIVFTVGPAGTGKSYIAVAIALAALKSREVKKIIITRPAVEAGESLGFLPGDLYEKIDPYMRPIYDALYDMEAREKIDRYLENGTIEVAPLAFLRGRTLDKAIVIADEMQNATTAQLKMLLTRLGPRGRMLVNGDPTQTDLPNSQESCLVYAYEILAHINNIKFVTTSAQDVVRHQLVADVIEAYATFQKPSRAPLRDDRFLETYAAASTNGNGVHH